MAVKRTGLTKLRDLAQVMCNLVGRFDPFIRRQYPGNTALFNALDAVAIACAVLVLEADNALPVGD